MSQPFRNSFTSMRPSTHRSPNTLPPTRTIVVTFGALLLADLIRRCSASMAQSVADGPFTIPVQVSRQ
ncbi:hypothetical protein XacyCFBP1159_13215 [Xanthomonas arboricola pv. corylina]|nr:hypothetical protein XacyCFBP1159_13215 [Xanthomonas arboricola pv. corylina]